jgi:hypothetical protein
MHTHGLLGATLDGQASQGGNERNKRNEGAVMSKAETNSRWYAPWRQASMADQDDAADMGTAFGLDLSIASEFPPAAEAPAAQAKVPSRGGWIKRLTLRARHAG